MTGPDAASLEKLQGEKLPRRDWILLPLLSLVTICGLAISCESIANRMSQVSRPFTGNCLGNNDPLKGAWAPPNSVCWDKKYESEWVQYRFNRCGHRAGEECGPKSPGVYRIVMTGTSYPMGHLMARDKTFAALLPEELSRKTGSKIEVYNEGLLTVHPHQLSLRFHEVLDADPDMILWILVPYDISRDSPDLWLKSQNSEQPIAPPPAGLVAKIRLHLSLAFSNRSVTDGTKHLWDDAITTFDDSALGSLLQHLLYQSQSQYVKNKLMGGDDVGFLKKQFDAKWQSRLQYFESDFANIASQAHSANVPLVVALVPERVEAAMISMGEWPDDFDPYKLDHEIRSIVTTHGANFIDIFPDYRTIPNPERMYFPVDSHPNEAGHAMIAALLTKELTNGVIPQTASSTAQVAQDHGR